METLKAQCPSCARRLKAPESAIGQRIRCPSCGHKFVLEPVGPPPLPALPRVSERKPARWPTMLGSIPIVFVVLTIGFVSVTGAVLWGVMRPAANETARPAAQAPLVAPSDTPIPEATTPVVAKPDPAPQPRVVDTVQVSPPEPSPREANPAASSSPVELAKAPVGEASAADKPAGEAIDPIEKAMRSVMLVKTEDGLGTGFVFHASNLVVTNFHVVAGAKEATAVFFDGSKSKVLGFRLVSRDYDFAILEIDAPHKEAVPLVACAKLPARGTDVYALGSPQGLAGTVTKGIISAYRTWPEIVKTLDVEGKDDEPMFAADSHWVQTSAPISSGNSGGPLVTPAGEVVAINTWVLTTGQNLNFSLDFARVAEAVKHQLEPRKPLAELPKARASAGGRGQVTEEEKVAVKAFWESLSKILAKFRRDLLDGPPLIEGQAGVQAFQTQAEWTLEVFDATTTALAGLPADDIPEPVLEFAVAIASRIQRAHKKLATLLEANDKHIDQRAAARLTRDLHALQQISREIDVLIIELAPRMKRDLERVLGAELPPIMGYEDP